MARYNKTSDLPTTAQVDRWAKKNASKLNEQDKNQWEKCKELLAKLMGKRQAKRYVYQVENLELDSEDIEAMMEIHLNLGMIELSEFNLLTYQLKKRRKKLVNELKAMVK